jgi:cyclase
MNTTLSRRGFLGASALVLAAGLTTRVAQAADDKAGSTNQDASAKRPAWFSSPIKATKLEDDFYVLDGAGGNNAVHFDAEKLFFVDSGIAPRGQDLVTEALKLSPTAQTRILFNTHWHGDHAGGNPAFFKAGFTIVGSTACRVHLGQTIIFEDLPMTSEPSPENSRPVITFDDKIKFHMPSAIAITKIPPAHTDSDAVAYFEKYNILHTGDLFFNGAFPVIDRTTGGSLSGIIAASKTLLTFGDAKTRIIPGHGPLADKAALQRQLDLLNLTYDRLAPLAEQKKTMDEVLALKPLADLDATYGKGFLQSPMFTRMAYGQWLPKK